MASPRTPPACIPPRSTWPTSANAALPPYPRLQASYTSAAHSVSSSSALSLPPLAPECTFTPPTFYPSLTPSGFFNGMLVVSQPGALNCYIFVCPIPLTLSVSKNLISTHLPLSGFLDSLLCDLIAPTPGLALSLVMPRTLAAASSFSSGGAYSSLKCLPPLFPRLILF